MDLKTTIETYTLGALSVNALGVTYRTRPLHTIDVERLMAFMREKLDYRPIAHYIARKMQNPSARAIKEMYNFLENRGMPLTLKGTFIAYKGVDENGWSITGNKETVVLQGEVNEGGHIKNTIGATIEVERSSVDDDFRVGCSTGLHVGSLAYATGFGKKLIYVEVDPKDVVSVPSECDCQKLRCCKYTVVGECSGQLPNTFTNEFSTPAPTETSESDDGVEEKYCKQGDDPVDECVCPSRLRSGTIGEETGCGQARTSTLSNIGQTILDIISEQFGVKKENITMDTTLIDLGADSLDGIELVMAFEEVLGHGFEIPDEEAEKRVDSTVGQIIKDIEAVLRTPTEPAVCGCGCNKTPAPSTQQYDIGVADGKQHRVIHTGMNLFNPKYLPDDVNGADSDAHADYIRGYVFGYNQ